MFRTGKRWMLIAGLLLCINSSFALEGVKVVYPSWFKTSLLDLPGDLQDARDAGKRGIMIFFTEKSCSYCNAMVEKTFREDDIVRRLRASYDVIGLEVFDDAELVDLSGKSLWVKDFAIQEKARFTPTMVFYGQDRKTQLRLIGYQSPEKFRGVLDYLDSDYHTQMRLGEYLQKRKSSSVTSSTKTGVRNLERRGSSNRPLLAVFESADCSKCQQLRTMLKDKMLQPYARHYDISYVTSDEQVITPGGKKLTGKEWASQLDLIHSPAMVFFNEQGKEVLRVDTDILVDQHGKDVAADDPNILGNIYRRLKFVWEKGYVSLPQFQRWNAEQARKKRNN